MKAAVIVVAGGLASKAGHDLTKLFAQLLKARADLGYDDDNDHARQVQGMIAQVQAFDPLADRFRYPTTRDGRPFEGVAVDYDELFQAHWTITTWCEGACLEFEETQGYG